jgi:hypothetical protein
MGNGGFGKGVVGAIAFFLLVIVVLIFYEATCGEITGRAKETCENVLNSLTIFILLSGVAGTVAFIIWLRSRF